MNNNDMEFLFMVNHLTRGNQDIRRKQAEGLREWARLQTVPVIAAGDYSFRNLTGNRSMAIFMRRDATTKVRLSGTELSLGLSSKSMAIRTQLARSVYWVVHERIRLYQSDDTQSGVDSLRADAF